MEEFTILESQKHYSVSSLASTEVHHQQHQFLLTTLQLTTTTTSTTPTTTTLPPKSTTLEFVESSAVSWSILSSQGWTGLEELLYALFDVYEEVLEQVVNEITKVFEKVYFGNAFESCLC